MRKKEQQITEEQNQQTMQNRLNMQNMQNQQNRQNRQNHRIMPEREVRTCNPQTETQ